MKKLAVLFALFALLPFALAACGGDDDETTEETTETTEETATTDTQTETEAEGTGGTVAVAAASEGFAFDQSELTASAGPTTFEFDNPAPLGHDFCLEQEGSDLGCTEIIEGASATLDADLESGEYTYYCSVAGHRDGGMEGTLTVE